MCVPLRRRGPRAAQTASDAQRPKYDPAGRRIKDPELRVVQDRGMSFPLQKPSGEPRPRRSLDPGRGQLATVYIAQPGRGDSVFLEDDVEGALAVMEQRRAEQQKHIERRHRLPDLSWWSPPAGVVDAQLPTLGVPAPQPSPEPLKARKVGSLSARKGQERCVRRLIKRMRRRAQREGIPFPGQRTAEQLIEDLQPSQRILSERQLARHLHLQSRTLAISNAQWHHMLGTGQRQRWAQQRWQRRLSINAGVGAWRNPCCTDAADGRVRIVSMPKLCSSLDGCCTSFQHTIFVLPRRRRLWR